MGTDDRSSAGPLIEQLTKEPYRFDFFQAARLAELLRPGLMPAGHGGSNVEAVSFNSRVGLDFPASDVVDVEIPTDPLEPVSIKVAFMGLAGGSGPLPTPFTELIMQRNAARDFATRDFLDIFNNRLISFLYRSRKKHRMALNNLPPEQTAFARWLFTLAGLEFASRSADSRQWARSLLRYAGMLSHQVRSMSALETMLSDFFKTPVRGEQLLGRWLVIEARDRTRIGRRVGANHKLGVDTVLGSRAWDQMGRIRLGIALPNLLGLRKFLPTGGAHQELNRLARLHLQQDVDIELKLSLAAGQSSGTRLGSNARLGWTSWINATLSRSNDTPVRLRLRAPDSPNSAHLTKVG